MEYNPEMALDWILHQHCDQPFVIAQLGQSLDGRIATPTAEHPYISSRDALAHLHRLRAHVDAVVVGVETANIDDPALTVRLVDGRNPTRVILDPSGRLSPKLQCLTDERAPTLVVRATEAKAGPCETVFIETANGEAQFAPSDVVSVLGHRGLRRILVEGGPTTVSRFLEAEALDRLHLLVAPVILGSGPIGLSLPPTTNLGAGRRPTTRVFQFGDGDVLFDCNLNIPGTPNETGTQT